ncbi:hypothetical protein PRIPAC_77597 [Pristionchus pacificus]|uniref:C6 domain-containing protein n=1 Tax=Pristionchus pacificus TaxID=54126 RepID=A0A2A6C2V7_PRIPA|nr:hypothetical protein PRIPAC_77597 [Pristionchus pacificus]|eukprot:PDM72505.1 hypothetical protein PRIPAC_38939 [Pristionchus pacificus]
MRTFLSSALLITFIASSDACMKVTPGTPGMPAVRACKTCSPTLIMLTQVGEGSHGFDTDTTSTTGACAVRTLTCIGNNPTITVNGDGGALMGATTVSFMATCNAAGTAWVSEGITITQLECASTPAP